MEQLKASLKLTMLLMAMVFMVTSCQDELDSVSEENNVASVSSQTSSVSIKKLKGKEAVGKAMLLQAKLSSSSSLDMSYRTNSNNGTIDYNNILEVIDSTGIANYTFKIKNHPDDSPTVFHNLVLTIDGDEQKITLLKYEFQNNETELEKFQGTITAKSFSTETNPCDETIIDANIHTGEYGGNSGAVIPNGPGNGAVVDPYNPNTGGGSNASGFSLSDVTMSILCLDCYDSFSSWDDFDTHGPDDYPFEVTLNMSRMAGLSTDPNPCGGNGTVGIISKEDEMINDIEDCLGMESEWLSNEATFEQINQINQYLDENQCSEEVQEIIVEFLESVSAYPFPHCSSFEYSKPPGVNTRACAVTNLTETFYAYGEQNGQLGTFVVTAHYSIVFFTMPTWMTNGQAATNTAIAVQKAFKITKDWFYVNYDATEAEIQFYLDSSLIQQMALFGGTKTDTPPFNIPSPAPYVTSLFSTGNCN